MADDVVRDGGRAVRALAGVLVGLAACAVAVLLAVASFEANPVLPAVVALVAIVGGTMLARRTHDPILKGLAVGLVVGGLVAVLLWPLFGVDSDGGVRI
jgi:peptidoglycan biosynthesis protein MviN/MurJ (putative lipid II flippase)